MSKGKHLLTIILLMLMTAVNLQAAYLFKSLGNNDGLSSSQVNCIIKDSKGYMWFGTPSGLCRYDGYTFHNFQSSLQDGSSLPDSYISSIQEMLDGSLLVETTSGYCVYQPTTESFDRDIKAWLNKQSMKRDAKIIFIDSRHNIWAYTPNSGVECFNMEKQLLFHFGYTSTATGIPQGNITGMGECKDGTVLVYSTGKIVCCDVKDKQQVKWQDDYWEEEGIKRLPKPKVFTDSKGILWIYGHNALASFNPQSKKWSTAIGDKLGISLKGKSDQTIYAMDEDNNGNVWIATDANGLIKMSVSSHDIERVQPISMKTEKVIGQEMVRTQSVYVDNTNLIWVGTQKFGVAYRGPNIYKFEGSSIGDITAITEDNSGNLYFGTESNGVQDISAQLASRKVSALAYTKDGSLWVGSLHNGLTRIKNGKSTIYSFATDEGKTLIDDNINALCTDKNNNLWIATNAGLQMLNTAMNSFSAYTKENGKLKSNDATALCYGSKNRMLVGTSDGLTIMSLSNNETTHLTGNKSNKQKFSNNYITSVCEDTRGLIWLGTREGVNVLDPDDDHLYYIDEDCGLCNNSICAIIEDKNKNIWVTTSKGVAKIITERDAEEKELHFGIVNYDESDGLTSEEFNKGALIASHNGDVVMGNMKGVNKVKAGMAATNDELPAPIFSQLFVGDQEIEPGREYSGDIPLITALNESREITLSNSMNSFIIKFAAGIYNQNEKPRYIYWMEGKDKAWKTADPIVHGVKFNKLPAGTYKLHVKVVGADGKVGKQERILEIKIERPWWVSWWMILAYIIIAAILLYIWRYGYKRLKASWKRRQIALDELENQKEEIKRASDDLRNPMARMTSIISAMAEKTTSIDMKEKLNSLHSQMLQIITRLTEMQIMLNDPQARAIERAQDKLLNGQVDENEHKIVVLDGEKEISYNIKAQNKNLPTKRFKVVLIDDNDEFLDFVAKTLREFYNFETYDNIQKAQQDLEVQPADLVICKQDMQGMSGSQLCNYIKSNPAMEKTKFVLLTDQVLSPMDIKKQGITLAADDYLAKPFNLQEAMTRFNQLLGIGDVDINSLIDRDSIKGDDKLLEINNASMTTAKMDYDVLENTIIDEDEELKKELEEEMRKQQEEEERKKIEEQQRIKQEEEEKLRRLQEEKERKREEAKEARRKQQEAEAAKKQQEEAEAVRRTAPIASASTIRNERYTMANATDQQLIDNIEAYVVQNMSRGQINMGKLAAAMGMGRVPFYHKVSALTKKTPGELIRDIRLKHACQLLARTNLSLHEIALNTGFITSENFIHIFKERYNISPLEYRIKERKLA